MLILQAGRFLLVNAAGQLSSRIGPIFSCASIGARRLGVTQRIRMSNSVRPLFPLRGRTDLLLGQNWRATFAHCHREPNRKNRFDPLLMGRWQSTTMPARLVRPGQPGWRQFSRIYPSIRTSKRLMQAGISPLCATGNPNRPTSLRRLVRRTGQSRPCCAQGHG